jgi:hypothetical protein
MSIDVNSSLLAMVLASLRRRWDAGLFSVSGLR